MRKEIRLDQFVIMPDHLYAIVLIDELSSSSEPLSIGTVGAHGRAPQQRKPRSLSSFDAAYKAASTRQIRVHLQEPGLLVWQRNFFDRIIRNQLELDRIREYILYNPLKLWEDW